MSQTCLPVERVYIVVGRLFDGQAILAAARSSLQSYDTLRSEVMEASGFHIDDTDVHFHWFQTCGRCVTREEWERDGCTVRARVLAGGNLALLPLWACFFPRNQEGVENASGSNNDA